MRASSNSGEGRRRRQRYVREKPERPPTLTPVRLALLRAVGDLEIASLPQLAALACPSQASARRHLRVLFDGGWVEVVPASRAAFALPGERQDPGLLFGSAPNLYALTRAGEKLLADLDGRPLGRRETRGVPSPLFLAHELAIRDVRVWLELTARENANQALETWHHGPDAAIDLQRQAPPKVVRPDAWFTYRLGDRVLVGLVEVDTGTERGNRRWREKLEAYALLYGSSQLRAVTGYANARVLVITPHAHRRDKLAQFIAEHAPAELARRFWLAEHQVLAHRDFVTPAWRQPSLEVVRPLVPAVMPSDNIQGDAK